MKDIKCRDCEREFNPELPAEKELGYYNQCGDCALDAGFAEEVRRKAFTGFTTEGDFVGIEIVDGDHFDEAVKKENEFTSTYNAITKSK